MEHVPRPLVLKLHDPDVQHSFLNNLDVEVFSESGAARLRVMRGKDSEDRIFLLCENVETEEELAAVLLDRAQARMLRDNLQAAVERCGKGESVVLKGQQYSVGEARRLILAIAAYVED